MIRNHYIVRHYQGKSLFVEQEAYKTIEELWEGILFEKKKNPSIDRVAILDGEDRRLILNHNFGSQ